MEMEACPVQNRYGKELNIPDPYVHAAVLSNVFGSCFVLSGLMCCGTVALLWKPREEKQKLNDVQRLHVWLRVLYFMLAGTGNLLEAFGATFLNLSNGGLIFTLLGRVMQIFACGPILTWANSHAESLFPCCCWRRSLVLNVLALLSCVVLLLVTESSLCFALPNVVTFSWAMLVWACHAIRLRSLGLGLLALSGACGTTAFAQWLIIEPRCGVRNHHDCYAECAEGARYGSGVRGQGSGDVPYVHYLVLTSLLAATMLFWFMSDDQREGDKEELDYPSSLEWRDTYGPQDVLPQRIG